MYELRETEEFNGIIYGRYQARIVGRSDSPWSFSLERYGFFFLPFLSFPEELNDSEEAREMTI